MMMIVSNLLEAVRGFSLRVRARFARFDFENGASIRTGPRTDATQKKNFPSTDERRTDGKLREVARIRN